MRLLFTIAVLPLLSVVAMAAAGGLSRWRFVRVGGAFRCKVRAAGDAPAPWPRLRRRWSRRRMLARWVDSVLVVRRGPIIGRTVSLPAQVSRDGPYGLPRWEPRRCGRRPLAVELVVSDGSRVEVAAPEAARFDLVGPYLAAAIHNLPRAPVPRHRIRRPGA
jgi:hypothetical protein